MYWREREEERARRRRETDSTFTDAPPHYLYREKNCNDIAVWYLVEGERIEDGGVANFVAGSPSDGFLPLPLPFPHFRPFLQGVARQGGVGLEK